MTPSELEARLFEVERLAASTNEAVARTTRILMERGLLTETELVQIWDSVELRRRMFPSDLLGPERKSSGTRAASAAPKEAPSVKSGNTTRSQAGKIGAHIRWANTVDRSAATQPARDGLMRKFEDQVDPDRILAADERAIRADSARRAHFQRLALKSAEARRKKQ